MTSPPAHDVGRGRSSLFSAVMTRVSDATLLIVAVLLFPLTILLVGALIALALRVLIEIARRL
jgi:hypothetical protein